MTPNEISHYESLKKQDTENRKLIRKLQIDKEELTEQLRLHGVGVPKGTFYCFNKGKGFNHSLCEVSQCKNCKQLEKQK
jgi:hypothetical protein